jgi:hypothetical protein
MDTKQMTSLSARHALQIAADFGFSIQDGQWEKSLIRDSIIQAREAAVSCPRQAAWEYFRGYMACTASEIYGEAMKARQFERDAY